VSRLTGRLDPVSTWLQSIFERVRAEPKRIVFAEGDDPGAIRAANSYFAQGLGVPVLVGAPDAIRARFKEAGIRLRDEFEIIDNRHSPYTEEFAEFLYSRLQRRGFLKRDCVRQVMNERNVFAALLVAHGIADCMVAGVTRNWTGVFQDVRRVIDPEPGRHVIGVSLALCRGRGVLVADTNVHDMPTAQELANIAVEAANAARKFGMDPRVALLTYSTFGQPQSERSDQVREAVSILAERGVDFEFDGDIAADVALSQDLLKLYPFCRLSGPANVLVMPAFHAASIATKMLKELGGATLIGPLLVGLSKSVQISTLGAKDADILNLAALAAYDFGG
jgi:malate dehydrogenase (oxaloacetate-decarboxylating)(NADP+)